MTDVTLENFEAEVIEASQTVPVLVDFWAPWCAPCQMLSPILDKLEEEYAGRFKLVKINTDEQKQLSSMFGIRSMPTCILMMEGRPVNGFVGAQPASEIRNFLNQFLPPADQTQENNADADQALEEMVATTADNNDLQTRLEKLKAASEAEPENSQARFDYIKLLLELGLDDEAKVAFAPVISQAGNSQIYTAIQLWLDARDCAFMAGDANAKLQELDQAIASNKRDFEARYARAQLLMAHNQWTAAMDELLEILMRDKEWEEGKARKTYVAVLDIIEPPKPPVEKGKIPVEDPTMATYRRRLSSVVLS